MPANASPFGLKIVKSQGGPVTRAPERSIVIANSAGTGVYLPDSSGTQTAVTLSSMYAGDPVYLDANGVPQQTAAGAGTAVGTISTNSVIGTFQGVEYSDSSGKRTVSNKWLNGTGLFPGSELWFWYTAATTADTIFEIQSSAKLTQAAVGNRYNIVYQATPGVNAVTGFSVAQLDATASAAGGGLIVYALAYDMNLATTGANNGYAPGTPTAGNNNWGDAYVNVYVKLANSGFTAAAGNW